MISQRQGINRLPIIGWREWVSLPSLGIAQINAKIDTGARTSAIHAFDIRPFTDRGAPQVAFVVYPEQRRRVPTVNCTAAVQDQRIVTSSSGHRRLRYVILVEVTLGDVTWPIEITLADRDKLGFRFLLGRQALKRRFLVDPNRSYILTRRREFSEEG